MVKKSQLDKYYTKPEIAELCLSSIEGSYDLWLEPSAGAGAFLRRLPNPRVGLDLSPDDDEILEQDFFTWTPPKNKSIAVVGNPPFGTNSSLAIKFFNEAAKWATLIAFIVPKTFKKVSVQNKLSFNWVIANEIDLPLKSFQLLDDKGNLSDYSVPCVWQVWVPGKRQKIKLPTKHKDWSWTDKKSATYAMRRVGGLAGKCFTEFDQYATESHYFFNCDEVVYNRLVSLYAEFQEISKNTAGNPSLSKGELVYIYEKTLASS
tara:strand:+ start:1048 stop:1833 length:786 start_codon:yes stop_codon:yes gene_type:complete